MVPDDHEGIHATVPVTAAVEYVQLCHGALQVETVVGQRDRLAARVYPVQPFSPVNASIVGNLTSAERAGPVEEYHRLWLVNERL